MTLDQLPSAASVLVDANILVFEFQPHPTFSPICHRLLERIENQDVMGFTTAHLLAETTHRLMVIEAGNLPGWAASKVDVEVVLPHEKGRLLRKDVAANRRITIAGGG